MLYIRFPLSLRNFEDLLFQRGYDLCHETVRLWWNRFGPMFAGDIRRQRVSQMRGFRHWRWHLDEMYVKLALSDQCGTFGFALLADRNEPQIPSKAAQPISLFQFVA